MKRFLATLFILTVSFILMSILFMPEEIPDVDKNIKENFDYLNDNCNFAIKTLNNILK